VRGSGTHFVDRAARDAAAQQRLVVADVRRRRPREMAGLVGAAVVVLRAGDAALRGVVLGSGSAHGAILGDGVARRGSK
jgi:hypothetical protein